MSELARITDLTDQARTYAQASKAKATWRAYGSDWRDFTAWCATRDLQFLPATPETVALYLTDQAAYHKVSTLTRRISAISQAHQAAGHPSPTKTAEVHLVMAGIRRTHGTAARRVAPATTDVVRVMVEGLAEGDLAATRDRALCC